MISEVSRKIHEAFLARGNMRRISQSTAAIAAIHSA